MLMFKNKLDQSSIHGLGLFTEEFIPAGAIMWKWHDLVDRKVSSEVVESLPEVCQETFKRYGWVEDGQYIICIDNEKYINHSDTPNCIFTKDGDTAIASRDIQAGEEITQDYRTFDDNFGIKEFGYDW